MKSFFSKTWQWLTHTNTPIGLVLMIALIPVLGTFYFNGITAKNARVAEAEIAEYRTLNSSMTEFDRLFNLYSLAVIFDDEHKIESRSKVLDNLQLQFSLLDDYKRETTGTHSVLLVDYQAELSNLRVDLIENSDFESFKTVYESLGDLLVTRQDLETELRQRTELSG